jgi:hypothetical protein
MKGNLPTSQNRSAYLYGNSRYCFLDKPINPRCSKQPSGLWWLPPPRSFQLKDADLKVAEEFHRRFIVD